MTLSKDKIPTFPLYFVPIIISVCFVSPQKFENSLKNWGPSRTVEVIRERKNSRIGLTIVGGKVTQSMFIEEVQPNSPASLRGLKVGDRIVKIDNTNTESCDTEEAKYAMMIAGNKIKIVVQSLLKKAKATKVNLINFLETKK